MSYSEYKEVVQFALDRLNLKKTFYILIYDTSTFIAVMNYHYALMRLDPKVRKELNARHHAEYGTTRINYGVVDCYVSGAKTKNQKVQDSWIKKTKELIEKGICIKENLESLEKYFAYDFLIIINQNIIDCWFEKEQKFICVVHEVLHILQEVGLLSRKLSARELDNLARPIVRDFLSKK